MEPQAPLEGQLVGQLWVLVGVVEVARAKLVEVVEVVAVVEEVN